MARNIKAVVSGSSIGSAAAPKNPLTPPLTAAITDESWLAGGPFAV